MTLDELTQLIHKVDGIKHGCSVTIYTINAPRHNHGQISGHITCGRTHTRILFVNVSDLRAQLRRLSK